MDRICEKCKFKVERYLDDYFCKCAIVDWIDSIRYGFPAYWVICPTPHALDGRDSAPSKAVSSPEVLFPLQAVSSSAHPQVS